MRRQLTITPEPIDATAWLARRQASSEAGAVVYFAGLVRGSEAGQPIHALEYEAFQRMAEHQFDLLFSELEKRWAVESVRVVHRVGVVQVNEPSLWVEVVAPHREEAFAACQFLIDQMKQRVPIWKRAVA